MARKISTDHGNIVATASESEDDVTVEYEDIKAVSDKATLFVIEGEKLWIPFSQTVDVYTRASEVRVTEWIASKKGLC